MFLMDQILVSVVIGSGYQEMTHQAVLTHGMVLLYAACVLSVASFAGAFEQIQRKTSISRVKHTVNFMAGPL